MPMHIERVKGEFRVNIMCILGASGDKSLSDEISLEDIGYDFISLYESRKLLFWKI